MLVCVRLVERDVSIHALLAECDSIGNRPACLVSQFQSTHSLRSATEELGLIAALATVSIHALLAECDILVLN